MRSLIHSDIFTGGTGSPLKSMMQALLFAANGVLYDTHELHAKALNQALAPHGMEITPEEDVKKYRGLPTLRKLEMLSEEKGLNPALHQEILALKQVYTLVLIDREVELDILKMDLLAAAKDSGLMVGVVSNSQQSTLVATLRSMGVYDFVDLCVGNDLGLAPKPAPDMYNHASEMLGVPISRCAIVERSAIGIKAAKSSGCPTIVRVKGTDEVVLSLMHFLLPNPPLARYI